jgi:hypothetical protein
VLRLLSLGTLCLTRLGLRRDGLLRATHGVHVVDGATVGDTELGLISSNRRSGGAILRHVSRATHVCNTGVERLNG